MAWHKWNDILELDSAHECETVYGMWMSMVFEEKRDGKKKERNFGCIGV